MKPIPRDVARENLRRHNKKMIKAYKQSLSIYDEILRGRTWWSKVYLRIFWGGVSDESIADELLSSIPKEFEGNLLDIPVGTGIFTASYYKKRSKAQITGIDYSEDMLEKCRAYMDQQGVSIALKRGDVGDLDLEDESVGLLLSMNGFHAFPDKERAYKSCLRVLKPGGLFYGCFYIRRELRMADLLVQHVLAPKGWFTPPFETRGSLLRRLRKDYDVLWFKVNGSIASFRCRKK